MLLALSLVLALAAPSPGLASTRELDRERISRHLAAVEAELRGRDVSHLPAALQEARRLNLDRLHAYRLAGEFPRNSHHPGERVPYFIDDDGVACAVGHLVLESGHAAVADAIAETENYARLLDMTHPALPGWIAASGLTAEECARIQPSYCECGQEYAPVCGVDGKSYFNACYAEVCAEVAIAHAGVCEGDSSSGWPPPGDGGTEATGPASSSGGPESTDTGGSTGDAATGGVTGDSDDSGTGSSGANTGSSGADTSDPEHDDPDGHDAKSGCGGCEFDGRGAAGAWLALLLLPRRRRRT